jgi:hypothetical protein
MKEPDYNRTIVPIEYFEANLLFAKKVIADYDDAKEKNCSWFGPKTPFYITRPKLIDNANTAKKVLRNKKTG